MLMLLAILLPIAAGGVLLVWRPQDPRRRQDFVVGSACAGAAAALTAVFTLRGEEVFQLLSLGERLSIAFRVDGLSCIFAVLVSVLWPLACLYAAEYMSREGGENRFFAFYLASLGVTLGIAFSANVLTMYFFYELLTLSTLPLVMHALDSKARYAGRIYLTYSMCGAALGFIAMVLLLEHGGMFFQFGGGVSVLAGKDNTLRAAYVLGFFGFGVKAAVFPGHRWLLRASVAPTPVTALLHAVAVVKAGVFAVTSLTWYSGQLGPVPGHGGGHVYHRLRLRQGPAYPASEAAAGLVHHQQPLLCPAGGDHPDHGRPDGGDGPHGVPCGAENHPVFLRGSGPLYVEGCGVLMPVVFGSFTAAALGLMGVPPLTGFTSKWMLATAAAGLGTWMGYLGASVLILSAVLTALYLMQIVLLAFFPRQNRQLSVRVPKRARRDPGLRMTVPITALAAGSVALGLGAGRLAGTVAALLG